jgi:1-acyl-sn-glycerol-3-phosphate acyltransferase
MKKTNKPKIIDRFTRRIVRLLLSSYLQVKVKGKKNLNRESNVIIISNHKSWIDPLLIIGYLPPTAFSIMAEAKVFKGIIDEATKRSMNWVKGFLEKISFQLISIDRSDNRSRLRSTMQTMRLLKNDGSLLIFPEGRMNQKDDSMHPYYLGAFKLAVKSETDILPIYIRGNEEIYFGRKINISIGQPIKVTKDMDAEVLARKVRVIQEEIKPPKPRNHSKKKRLNTTNLFLGEIINKTFTNDVIIKGEDAIKSYQSFDTGEDWRNDFKKE